MSSKRAANTELNHDNWNEEQESEEAGQFQKAKDDILLKRVRKVAKRRLAGDSSEDGSAPVSNPFTGFGGFHKGSLTTSTPAPFSFLSTIPAVNSNNGEAPLKNSSAFKITSPLIKTNNNDATKNNSSEYFSKVKSLNQAFVDWIKANNDESKGLCDLRPVFQDYEKYMKEFQELKDNKKVSTDKQPDEKKEAPSSMAFTFGKPASTASNMLSPASSSSIFSSSGLKPKESSPVKPAVPENKPFSFGIAQSNSLTSNLSATPAFSFGLQKTSTGIGSSAAPIFGSLANTSSTPFSFGNVTQSAPTTAEEETEEEPPKNEFVPVVEDDSLYSKRCKVFVKTGADYADRGVGTLYLKKVDDKVQLIVRADTNLGNILLNIIICDGLPTSRLGKNNVMIVCLPTPESKPPPIPVLVRVKTGDEADELLATLEKYKKA